MALNKTSHVISPKPIFTNINEIKTDEDIHYNSPETHLTQDNFFY